MTDVHEGEELELDIERVAHGGVFVAHHPDGDLLHGEPQIHRGLLDPAEGIGLAQPETLLEHALGTVDDFACLEPLGEIASKAGPVLTKFVTVEQ